MDEQSNHIKTPKQLRIGSAIFFFISGFGYSTWASRIPNIKLQLHLNEAQLGTVLFALPIGLMCTMPITSRLLTHYSSRAIMLFGSIFLSVILILIGLTNTMWQLIAMLFCFGSARNLMTLSINTQGVAVQALYSKSIMATFHGIWSLAGFAGAAVGLLMVYFNIAPTWHFLLVSIALTIMSLYFIKDTLYQKPLPITRESFFSPSEKFLLKFILICSACILIYRLLLFDLALIYRLFFLIILLLLAARYFIWRRRNKTRQPLFLLPDKYLLKFSLVCFACMACENTMYDWSALYFQKEVHTEKTIATAAFVIYLVAMTTGRFFGDKIVTRMGIKTVLKFSGLFIFSGLMLAVLLPYLIPAVIGFILIGFGVSCIVPMIFSLAGKSKNMSSSSALASISTIGYLGFLFVPPFVGFIAQNTNLRWSFGIIALFGALIVYLVSKISDDHEQNAPVILPGYE